MLSIAFHTVIHQANKRLPWTWPLTSEIYSAQAWEKADVYSLFDDNASEYSSNILFTKRLGRSHRVLKIVWYPKCGNQKCDSHVERRKRTSRTSPGEKQDYIWIVSQLTIGEEPGLVCNHLSRKVELHGEGRSHFPINTSPTCRNMNKLFYMNVLFNPFRSIRVETKCYVTNAVAPSVSKNTWKRYVQILMKFSNNVENESMIKFWWCSKFSWILAFDLSKFKASELFSEGFIFIVTMFWKSLQI